MATVDASIPLSGRPIQIESPIESMGKAYQLKEMQEGMQDRQEKRTRQNELRSLYAGGEYGTEGFAAKLGAVDPTLVPDYQKDLLSTRASKATIDHLTEETKKLQGEHKEKVAKAFAESYMGVKEFYEKAAAQFGPEKAAMLANVEQQRAITSMVQRELMTPEEAKQMPQQFDPASFYQMLPQVMTMQQRLAAADKKRNDDLEERKFGETTRHNKSMESKLGGGASSIAVQQFAREHPDATAEEFAAFIQKTRAAPRSAPAMALAKFIEENPDASSEDVERFNASIRSTAKATGDFATGKQGQAVNSFNVGIYHLDTLRDLSRALNNSDIKMFNRLGNAWAEQTGQAAPTNFDTAKQIIGAEVVKAIVGMGGGVSERQEAADHISRANSPAQLEGAIQTTMELMGGQLKGLRQQYQQTTKRADFDERLSPHAREVLKKLGGDEQSANSFATEAEAEAAAKSGKLKAGDKITVGGKSATWQ